MAAAMKKVVEQAAAEVEVKPRAEDIFEVMPPNKSSGEKPATPAKPWASYSARFLGVGQHRVGFGDLFERSSAPGSLLRSG